MPLHEMPEDFRFTDATRSALAKEYPQLDIDKTEQAFIEWGTNAVETNKRHPRYGQPLECKNWQMKAKNVIRIQVINKWSSIAIPKQGFAIDMRWQETLTKARDIGFDKTKEGERRSSDTVESYKYRMTQWEKRPMPTAQLFDFSSLKMKV